MRILAVDPGLTRCGVAVVDAQPSRRVSLVHVSVAVTATNLDLGVRLMQLEDHINEVADRFDAAQVAIERVFSQHNVQTVIGTAQAAGVVALLAARRGLPTAFHTPSEVKAAVTGSGRADKKQVAALVAHIVGVRVEGPADATDAVALAICHAWRGAIGRSVGANANAGTGTGMRVGSGIGVDRAGSRRTFR